MYFKLILNSLLNLYAILKSFLVRKQIQRGLYK
jgi:hypothetical protein